VGPAQRRYDARLELRDTAMTTHDIPNPQRCGAAMFMGALAH
jgi:hypothetical protein